MIVRVVSGSLLGTSLLVLSAVSRASGQEITIAGRVHTRAGAPISGAHVRVVGRPAESVTDASGEFGLRLANAGTARPDTLRVDRLGFMSQRLPVELREIGARVDIEMTEVAIRLDEVVVTATAGTQTRRAQAGVVTTIPVADLHKVIALPTVADALQGRVSSVDVTPSSGSSGEAQRIWLRGATSNALSNEPLIFIDGIRADARLQRLRPDDGGQSSSRLFDLDPAEIDRIEIVKGPAASTMYGADASTGVIQIFTRRGSVGRARFSQHVEVESGLVDANYSPPTNYARCAAADAQPNSPALLCHGLSAGAVVSDNPLRRDGVLNTGRTQTVRWSADGGGANFGVYTALSAASESGTLPQNGFDRGTLRFGSRWAATPSLLVDAGFGLMRTRTTHPQNGDNPDFGLLAMATLGSPLTVGTRTDGALNTPINAAVTVEQALRVTRATPTLQIVHTAGQRLNQRLTFGVDATSSVGHFFVPLRYDSAFIGTSHSTGTVRADEESYQVYSADYLGTASLFDNVRRGIKSTASIGAQYVEITDETVLVAGSGFVSNYSDRVSDAAERTGNVRGPFHTKSLGTYGLLELAARDRLFLQGGVRGDRHSAFGPRAGLQFFPKAGVSFIVADGEQFRSHVPFVRTLRVRAAYGTSGRAMQQGAASATYSPAPVMTGPNTFTQGLTPGSPGNPKLRPERGVEVEYGADAGFLNDQLALELTVFDKRSKDLLALLPQPPSLGFPRDPMGNVDGVIRNTGVEATLRWTGVLATRHLDSQLGFSTLNNTAPLQHDRPLGAMFDYRLRRIDVAQGQAIVSDTSEYVGPSMPKRTAFWGLTAELTRTVRVHTSVDGKWGYWQHNMDADVRDRYVRNSERSVRSDRLSAEERLARFGPFVTEGGRTVSTTSVLGSYLQDASFVRWREVSVSWDLPHRLRSRMGAQDAFLSLSARNLRLWTRYEGDPEVVSAISENESGGAAQYAQPTLWTMPQATRWTTRLSITF